MVSKQVGKVTLNFADGQARAQAHAEAGAYVDRAAATLPEDVREKITRPRKAGDADAAVDDEGEDDKDDDGNDDDDDDDDNYDDDDAEDEDDDNDDDDGQRTR